MEEPTTPPSHETYLVFVELEDEKSRPKLVEKLKEFPGYCPLTQTAWAIRSKESMSDVRDTLRDIIGTQGRVFVFKSGHAGSWYRAISQKHSDWLKKYL